MLVEADSNGAPKDPRYNSFHKFWNGSDQTLNVFETKEEWNDYVLTLDPYFFDEKPEESIIVISETTEGENL